MFAFCAAGLLLAVFGLLAFRFAQTLCLHPLVFWVYFAALPLATAWLYSGHITARALIGQDLYSDALADAFTAHAAVFALYGLGVLLVAVAFSDAKVAGDVQRTLAAQRFSVIWPSLFATTVLTQAAIRLHYDILLSGSGTAERVLALPYVVSSLLQVLGSVTFALFCYCAVLSARAQLMLVPCLAYMPYALATEGRRATLTALIVLFALRRFSLGFKPNKRLAAIALAALALFILVGPIFVEARKITISLQRTGTPIAAALQEGVSGAVDSLATGDSDFGDVADNVAHRGNAGTFFLTVAERHVEPQLGAMTSASILWAIPSVFVVKPALQVEAMIQLLASMRFIDDANSVPLVLYVDFGALGMFIAGAATAFLLYLLAKLIGRGNQFGIFEVMALGTLLSLSFSIETELSGVFAEIRNVVLFAPVALLARFLAPALDQRAERRLRHRRPRRWVTRPPALAAREN